MVANDALIAALLDRAAAVGVHAMMPERIEGFEIGPTAVSLRLASGDRLQTTLLVAADGARSRLRALAGIGVLRRDYHRVGIVATVAHAHPHHGRADEHFLPAGPFARLPLTDDAEGRHRSSLVWTEHPEVAERLLADDPSFRAGLEQRLGLRLGAIEPLDRPRAHPLALAIAHDFVRPRFALIGDAAHAVHPIAGQGLNLGLRDVAVLAETVIEARRLGLDPGDGAVLAGYRRRRRSPDLGGLRAIRDLGLGLVDRSPSSKRWLIREAAGFGGSVPRLLRGEPL
jgi:2-octaprenyl-6-methoxyphenol hydroxylase